ncbi:acyl-CoA thioesterase [Aquabacterium sp.]|uniref:acyl-CoA thioesterase n=1 Tax=Aquabacterium sp. TaxID=1872578 RepID=UPI0035AE8237
MSHASLPATVWDRPDPHTLVVTVQPEHIDLMQHTNNVVYLQWLEDVAWAHSTHLGLGPDRYTALGHGMVVRQHELNYLQATRLGDEIVLGTWLVGIDKLSLHRQYQFVRASDGVTVFRGRTHFVCVEIESGRVRRMLPEFFAAYSAAVREVAPDGVKS